MRVQFANDRDNAFRAWQALRGMGDGDTLYLGGGEIHFYPDNAFTKYYPVSNNESSDKRVAFPIVGRHGVTIDGEGATLVFHGFVTPFIIDNSTDIVIRNLNIDYGRPFYSQAKVCRVCPDGVELDFPPEYPVRIVNGGLDFYSDEDGWSTGSKNRILITEFDKDTGKPTAFSAPYLADFNPDYVPDFLASMTHRCTVEQLENGHIFLKNSGAHIEGAWCVMTHGFRRSCGILIFESERVLTENINLWHTEGMGVVGEFSADITLRNVNAVPRPNSGRLLSVSADATHFVHCFGKLEIDRCTFVNMLDDALNVHGNYTTVDRLLDDRTLLTRFGHFQHYGLPLYRPGDRLALVEPDTIRALGEMTVEAVEIYSPELVLLRFAEPFNDAVKPGIALGNYERMPEVRIHDCVTGWNRPRGFLISTGKSVVIERCKFFNQSCAVHLTGDAADWFESGPVSDLVIRDNDFDNSAYLGGAVIAITPHMKREDAPVCHRNIRVENNRFRLHEPRFLEAHYAANIQFVNNTYTQDESLPSHPFSEADGFSVSHLEDCTLEPPVRV